MSLLSLPSDESILRQKRKVKRLRASKRVDKDIEVPTSSSNMIANDAISVLKLWNFESGHQLGDGADVISSTFTYLLTTCLSAVMVVKTYVLSPIECYIPISLGGMNLQSYVNNYCFVEGSVAFHKATVIEKFPQTKEQWDAAKKVGKVDYYPWIPLYLGVMALIPFLISLLWKILYSRRIGTDLQGLLEMAHKAQLHNGWRRQKLIERISTLIADTLWKNREYRTGRFARMKRRVFEALGFGFFSKRFGSYLNFWYFIVKLAYLVSHFVALHLMHKFLNIGNDYLFFGFQIFHNIMSGKFWDETLIFPRVTWCNVPIKHNRVNYSVAQCVLPGNLFSEIIFALLWIWHAICIVPMIASMIKFVIQSVSASSRRTFIQKFLTLSGEMDDANPLVTERMIGDFGKSFLRDDGYFALRMFESAVGTPITCDIAAALWRIYKKNGASQIQECGNAAVDMVPMSDNRRRDSSIFNGNRSDGCRTLSKMQSCD